MILVKNKNFKKVLINDINVNIPNEWVYGNLENIAIIKSGIPAPKTFNNIDFQKDKKIPFFRVSNLSKSIKYLSSENTHEFLDYNSYKKNIILKDSILIAKSGESIKKKYRNILKEDSIVVGHIAALYPKCNKDYLYHLINYQQPENYLIKGAAMPSIGLAELNKFQIFYTEDLNFQKNISKILNKQESIILNIEKLISKTEKIFDYLKNELLYGTTIIDFKNGNINLVKYSDRSNIRKVKFNDIISFSMGNTPKKVDDNYNGDIPWITISNLKCKYITDYTAFIKNSKNIKIIPKDTLIGSFKMSVGRFGFTTEDCCTNEAIIAIKKEDTKENLDYLYYLLPKYFNDNAEKNGQGIPLLNSKKIKDIILDIPPLEEQNKIVNFLKKYENLIENQKKLLEKEKQKFEWLSEKLLSGEYLVVDEE